MPQRKSLLLATTSAIAVATALGSGCSIFNSETTATRAAHRTGDGAQRSAGQRSAAAVRGYSKAAGESEARPAPTAVAGAQPNSSETLRVADATDGQQPAAAAAAGAPFLSTSAATIAMPSQPAGGGMVAGFPKGPVGRPAEPVDTAPQLSALPSSLPGGPPSTGAWPSVAAERFTEARRLLERGRVHEARALLERMSSTAPIAALHELGRTYDPYYLGMLPSIDAASEARRAAAYYQEAIIYGSPTAGQDLDRLRASHHSLR